MPTTLFQHVQHRHGSGLAEVLQAVAAAAVQVEQALRTAGLADVLGTAGYENIQGEQQQKLDVIANEILSAAIGKLPTVAGLVSEEDDAPVVFAARPDAPYVVLFDPLDGSSNLDVNVNVGTIVSVQTRPAGTDAVTAALQAGSQQTAALYVNYGPSTLLVYTAGRGVHSFTLSSSEFVLAAEDLRMPASGPYYSLNEGNLAESDPAYTSAVAGLRDGSLTGDRHGSRYVGSFIADFHRTLLKGGIFLYPPTKKNPHGKLRLLYEASPLSFVAEQAGGAATDGQERILDLLPAEPHVRTPLVIGSRVEVSAVSDMLAGSPRE